MRYDRYDPYARDDLMAVTETVRDVLEEIADRVRPIDEPVPTLLDEPLDYDSTAVKDICCKTLPVDAERHPDLKVWGVRAQAGDARAVTWLVDEPYVEFQYRGEDVGEYHVLRPHSIVDVIDQYCHQRATRYAPLDAFSHGQL